jgi:hypothetical protein
VRVSVFVAVGDNVRELDIVFDDETSPVPRDIEMTGDSVGVFAEADSVEEMCAVIEGVRIRV